MPSHPKPNLLESPQQAKEDHYNSSHPSCGMPIFSNLSVALFGSRKIWDDHIPISLQKRANSTHNRCCCMRKKNTILNQSNNTLGNNIHSYLSIPSSQESSIQWSTPQRSSIVMEVTPTFNEKHPNTFHYHITIIPPHAVLLSSTTGLSEFKHRHPIGGLSLANHWSL